MPLLISENLLITYTLVSTQHSTIDNKFNMNQHSDEPVAPQFACASRPPSLFLSLTHTHAHTDTHTERQGRGQPREYGSYATPLPGIHAIPPFALQSTVWVHKCPEYCKLLVLIRRHFSYLQRAEPRKRGGEGSGSVLCHHVTATTGVSIHGHVHMICWGSHVQRGWI